MGSEKSIVWTYGLRIIPHFRFIYLCHCSGIMPTPMPQDPLALLERCGTVESLVIPESVTPRRALTFSSEQVGYCGHGLRCKKITYISYDCPTSATPHSEIYIFLVLPAMLQGSPAILRMRTISLPSTEQGLPG